MHRKESRFDAVSKGLKHCRQSTQQCLSCYQPADSPVCSTCLSSITQFSHSVELPFINQRPDVSKHLKSLHQHPLVAVGPHQGQLQNLINQFKYGKKSYLAQDLAQLLCVQVSCRYKTLPEAILPVPMHPLKTMIRGFNQTDLLARAIGQQLTIPTQLKCIFRHRYQAPQAGKTGSARRQPINSPFEIKAQQLKTLTHICLLDDVVTTGTTLAHLCKDIRRVNPALRVDLWCLSVSLPR